MNEQNKQIEWIITHLQFEINDIFVFENMSGNKSYKGKLHATKTRLKYILDNLDLWQNNGILPDEINNEQSP